MKRVVPAILIFLVLWTTAYPQDNFASKFGQANRSDFEPKQDPSYPDAPAVVLNDLGKVQFYMDEKGVTIVYWRGTRIRIFTDAGKPYAKVNIPYTINDDVSEMVYNVEAFTFNHENGRIVKTKLKSGTSIRKN